MFVSTAFAGSVFPYFPESNAKLEAFLNSSSLTSQCASQKISLELTQLRDNWKYFGTEEPKVDLLIAKGKNVNMDSSPRVVLIVCGFRARHFIATDVCINFIKSLCAGDVSESSSTVYMIAPMVNKRMRDFVMRLWPEFRGENPRPWGEVTDAVSDRNYRVLGEVTKGGVFAAQNYNPSDANAFKCFDGSYHLTLLDQNFPVGWMERLSTGAGGNVYTFHTDTEMEIRTYDSVSINGQIAASDPESRMFKSLLSNQHLRISLLIEVTQEAMSGVLSPYESPMLANVAGASDAIKKALQQSEARAASLAAKHCPTHSCLGGVANVARMSTMNYRSGTIGDLGIKTGAVDAALIIQIGHIQMGNQISELQDYSQGHARAIRDCLGPYTPHYQSTATKMIDDWTDLLKRATTSF